MISAYGFPFTSVKAGLAAFDTIPAAGTLQLLLLFIAALELGFRSVQQSIETDYYNYMDAVGWGEKKQLSKRTIELNKRPRRTNGYPHPHGA